jgi:hypothetical protein
LFSASKAVEFIHLYDFGFYLLYNLLTGNPLLPVSSGRDDSEKRWSRHRELNNGCDILRYQQTRHSVDTAR